MVYIRNCKTMSKFVKVMQGKLWTLFPDTVYSYAFHLNCQLAMVYVKICY